MESYLTVIFNHVWDDDPQLQVLSKFSEGGETATSNHRAPRNSWPMWDASFAPRVRASHTPVSRPLKKWWFLRHRNIGEIPGIQEILSGYVKIAIENDHWNSGFSHSSWWFSIAMLNYQRVSTRKPRVDRSESFSLCFFFVLDCAMFFFFPPSGQPTRNADSTENIFLMKKGTLNRSKYWENCWIS